MEDAKRVSESAVDMVERVLPNDTNSLGTLFGGRLMQWIDIAASIVAARHSRRTCVTASMDQLSFLAPIRIGQIVILKAALNFVAHSSMEVGVKVLSEDPITGEQVHTSSAYLTFVALDEKGKTIGVPRLIPETDDENRRFREGDERRRRRLAERQA